MPPKAPAKGGPPPGKGAAPPGQGGPPGNTGPPEGSNLAEKKEEEDKNGNVEEVKDCDNCVKKKKSETHIAEVCCIAWQRGKETLAWGSDDGIVEVWTEGEKCKVCGKPKRVETEELSHSRGVTCLDWSIKGDLGTGCWDGYATVWKDCKKVASLIGHSGHINDIKFTPAGDLLATASEDKTCRIWKPSNGDCLKKVRCGGYVLTVVWRDEKRFFTGCWDSKIQHWSLDPAEDPLTLRGHKGAVYSLSMQPSDKLGSLKPDDHQIKAGCLDICNNCNQVPVGSLLASGSKCGEVIVWFVDTYFPRLQHTLVGHKSSVREVKFSKTENQIVASWELNGEVRIWDVVVGNCLHVLPCPKDKMTSYYFGRNNISFSPNSKLLACRGGEVRVFTVATGELADTCNVEGGHVTWNSLGNKLAVVFKDRHAVAPEGKIHNDNVVTKVSQKGISDPSVNKDEKDNKEEDTKDTKDKVKDKESKQFQDVVIFNIGNCCGGECSNNCEEKAKKAEEERAKAAAARGRGQGMDPRGRGRGGAPGGRGGAAAGRGRGDGGRGRGGAPPRGRAAAPARGGAAPAKKGMFGF